MKICRRERRFASWILLLTGAILTACSSIGGAPVDELGELATEGGEKHLREPLRPIRGETRVLVIALDGVGDDDLRRAIREGRMPRVAALLGAETGERGLYEHAYAAEDVLTTLPSSTVVGWSSLFTGRPPAETGIPGDEWFVREEMRLYAPTPVSVESKEHALEAQNDGSLGELIQVPTLYERLPGLRSHVSLSPVHRGADLLSLPDPGTFGDLFWVSLGSALGGETENPSFYHEVDEASVNSLIDSMHEHGVPDVQVVYLPGIDLATHILNPPLEGQQEYLEHTVDPWVGRVLDVYEEAGVLDRTYVLFVADHGHTPVLADDRHALGTEGDDEPPALLEHIGFRVRPFEIEVDKEEQDYQAVLAYQGAIAFLYLADRSTCPRPGDRCDWARPPRLEADVLPVVRALDAANRDGTRIPALKGTLDLIFARAAGASGEAAPFQVFNGERLVPIAEYLRENPRPDLLRLEQRLNDLALGPYGSRAGDVLLLARQRVDEPLEERFYFSAPYHSMHGSPNAQDSRVPLIVARPGGSGAELRRQVRSAVGSSPSVMDVTPLVRALLQEP